MAFTVFDPLTASATSLVDALLAPSSGIVVNGGSVSLHSSGPGAVSYYDAAVGTPLGIGAGVLLTSGITPGTSNTLSWFGADNSGSTGFANGDVDIDAVVNSVFQTQSYDATTLSFSFSVSDPLATSISFDLVFGSDEYPEWVDAFVDCGVVILDGVNYALFNNDPLHPLSVISPNLAAGYFQDNGGNTLPIEYDGVSGRLRIVAPLQAGQSTHTIKIGISDTGDHILDSGLFLANFSAGKDPGSGVVANPGGGTNGNDSCTGSSKDEYFDLKAGDDTVYAGGGADIIVAGSGNDKLYAGTGNDALKGDGGDDLLDGGADLDTAVYGGASTAYTLSADPLSGAITIDGSSQGEGVDLLLGVEQLQFSDGLFAFSAPGSTTLVAVLPATPPPAPINHAGMVLLTDPWGQTFNGPVAQGAVVVAQISDADGLSGDETVQWFRDGQQITGATGFQYTVQEGDANHSLLAQVSYSDANGNPEQHSSDSLLVLAAGGDGEPVLSLMNVGGPAFASVHTPLTTLVMSAIALGETPNTAMQKIRAALQVPSAVASLLSTNAFQILSSGVGNTAAALALAKLEAQVAILCSTAIPNPANGSYSTDPAGAQLTALLLQRADAGQTFDLASASDLVALHPELAGSATLDLLTQRNGHIRQAVKLLGAGDSIETEWADFISSWDLTLSQIPLSVISQAINQAPTGLPSATLPAAVAGEPFTLTAALLLQGFQDPDGDPLSVSALSTDQGDWFADNGDGSWSLDPTAAGYDPAYVGPLELHYAVDDGQGHSLAASQMLVVEALNHAPTGSVTILGLASQGQTLTATNTLADADGIPTGGAGALHYQWLVDGVALAGATGASLLLSQAEVGHTIGLSAAYTDGLGHAETVLAAATAAVANVDDAATGSLALAGIAKEGESLVAALTNVVDPDGPTTVAYRWQRLNGSTWSDIAGAVGATLAIPLGQNYAGVQVRVVATSIDALGGSTAFLGQALTIAPALLPPPAPSFALLADTGSSASDGLTNNGTVSVSGLIAGNAWQYRLNSGAWTAGSGTSFSLAAGSYAPGRVSVRQSDLAGNTSPAVANAAAIKIDTTLPTLTSQLVGGTSLVLRFSEPVAFPGASAARFSVLNGKTAVAVNGIGVDAAAGSVTLTLASAITSASLLTIAYSDPSSANEASGVIEDLAGNDLASRSATTIRTFLASGSVSMASGFNSGYIGVELSDSAGAASLSGNAAANELRGNAAGNALTGGGGADVITGGGGADDFRWMANSDSLLGTSTAPGFDRLLDLVIGTDTLTMATSFAAPAGSISDRGPVSSLSEAAIAAVLPSSGFAAGTAAAFSFGSGTGVRTFLVCNEGVAGFQAASDALIEITGFSGNLSALAIV